MMINLIFIIISLVSIIILFVLPTLEKRKEKLPYFSCFPFETVSSYKGRISQLILVFLCACFILTSYVLYLNSSYVLLISANIFYFLSILGLIGVYLFTLNYYRYHLISAIMFGLGLVGGNFLLFLDYLINTLNKSDSLLPVYFAVVLLITGLFVLILFFLKKTMNWMKLDKIEDNGKVLFLRPKVNYLVLVEYVSLFAHFINLLVFLINYFIN